VQQENGELAKKRSFISDKLLITQLEIKSGNPLKISRKFGTSGKLRRKKRENIGMSGNQRIFRFHF
jgi:hypothetical protein